MSEPIVTCQVNQLWKRKINGAVAKVVGMASSNSRPGAVVVTVVYGPDFKPSFLPSTVLFCCTTPRGVVRIETGRREPRPLHRRSPVAELEPRRLGQAMIIIELPLPPRELSPNFHGSWWAKARATKEYRQRADVAYRLAQGPLRWQRSNGDPIPVKIHVTFFCGPTFDARYRPLDGTNAQSSLKAAIDGLVDAGLVPSDSHKWVSWGEVRLLRTKKEHLGRACVQIVIENSL